MEYRDDGLRSWSIGPAGRRRYALVRSQSDQADFVDHRCGLLERMPKWLICVPLALQWLVLALRYRSITLPSTVNAAITSGGLIGEGKLEYFEGMGPVARAATAEHCAISTGSKRTRAQLRRIMRTAGLSFPVVAKPDVGLCGYGVRLLSNSKELLAYVAAFPLNETIVLQRYLPQEGEAGIFYARDPDTDEGRIIGLALRRFPQVVGDGCHSIGDLIALDPRRNRLRQSGRAWLGEAGSRIPRAGEVVRLATVGSTRVGGVYRNGGKYVTPQLTAAIDAIARDMPSFYFGRFDVRFPSLHELQTAGAFTIMEINGAGSEAIHAWDPDIRLWTGLGMIFAKQRLLFSIGAARRGCGARPITLRKLIQLYRRQARLIPLYPQSN